MVATGRELFSTVLHQGLIWLRLNLVNNYTQDHRIETLAELIEQTARTLARRE